MLRTILLILLLVSCDAEPEIYEAPDYGSAQPPNYCTNIAPCPLGQYCENNVCVSVPNQPTPDATGGFDIQSPPTPDTRTVVVDAGRQVIPDTTATQPDTVQQPAADDQCSIAGSFVIGGAVTTETNANLPCDEQQGCKKCPEGEGCKIDTATFGLVCVLPSSDNDLGQPCGISSDCGPWYGCSSGKCTRYCELAYDDKGPVCNGQLCENVGHKTFGICKPEQSLP